MDREFLRSVNKNLTRFRKAKYSRSQCAMYAISFSDGDYHICTNHACHAEVMSEYYGWNGKRNKDPVAIISQLQEYRAGEDVARRFYEWLLNYSPYRSVFLSKNANKAVDNNVVVVDTDNPNNLVGGALVATRFATEAYSYHTWRCAKVWDKLVHYGLHPNAAYILSHALRCTDDDTVTVSVAYHVPVRPNVETLKNFTLDKPLFLNKPWRQTKSYSGTDGTWFNRVGSSLDGFAQNVIDQMVLNRKIEAQESKNPFAASSISLKNNFSIDAVAEEMAFRTKIFMKENGINVTA